MILIYKKIYNNNYNNNQKKQKNQENINDKKLPIDRIVTVPNLQ